MVSGFMICRSLFNKHQDVKYYFVERIKKLYPQYIFALIVMTLYCAFIQLYHGIGDSIGTIITNFFTEIFMLQGLLPCLGANNYPMWYMAVLLWGGTLVYFVLKKIPVKWIIIFSPIYIAGYYAYNFIVSDTIEVWSGINTLLRGIADMMIGVLLYFFVIKNRYGHLLEKYSVILRVVGLTGVIWCLCSVNFNDVFALLFLPILIIGSLYSKSDYLHISKWSKYCYPIYLNHALVIDYIRRLLNFYTDNNVVIVLGVLLSIILYSICAYHLVHWIQNKILIIFRK
jgi:peptidoglycan/LPS O-acetylase OafA/YrhL